MNSYISRLVSRRLLLDRALMVALVASILTVQPLFAIHVHVNIKIHPPPIPSPHVTIKRMEAIADHAEHEADEIVHRTANTVSHEVEHVAQDAGKAEAQEAAHLVNEVKHTASEVENGAKRDAAHLGLDAAHAALIGVEQVRKQATPMAAKLRASVAYTDRLAEDVRNGRFGHATEDLGKAVTCALAAVQVDAQDLRALTADAREAIHDDLDAIKAARAGRWSEVAESMGRCLAQAGNIVAAAGEPEVGETLNGLGHAIKDQAPYAKAMVADIKHGDVKEAAHEAVADYVKPMRSALSLSKSAAESAKNGKFGEATLQASLAVTLASSATSEAPLSEASERAINRAQAALEAVKHGQFGEAGKAVGDAVNSVGEALKAAGDEKNGQELADSGAQIHQYADTVQEVDEDAQQNGP
jgi:hypothetical protein